MKKHLFAILSCVALTTATNAQTTESTIKIDKTERSAISSEYNMSSDALKDALKESFKSKGVKLEKSKGLLTAKAVSIQELGNNMYDVYFSVDPTSRTEKNKSVIKMALSSGYNNFISPANVDVYPLAKNYLASLSSSVYAEKKQVDISVQTESFTKAQKKYNNLVKEIERLEKQRKNIEGDIAENKRNQDLQLKEMERQKAALDLLKSGGSK